MGFYLGLSKGMAVSLPTSLGQWAGVSELKALLLQRHGLAMHISNRAESLNDPSAYVDTGTMDSTLDLRTGPLAADSAHRFPIRST